jgi:hypothetical protein
MGKKVPIIIGHLCIRGDGVTLSVRRIVLILVKVDRLAHSTDRAPIDCAANMTWLKDYTISVLMFTMPYKT